MESFIKNLLFVDLNNDNKEDNNYLGVIDFIQNNLHASIETLYSVEEARQKLTDADYNINIVLIWIDRNNVSLWKEVFDYTYDEIEVIVIFGFDNEVQKHVHEVMRCGAYAFACPFNQSVLNAYIEALAIGSEINAAIGHLRSEISAAEDLQEQIKVLLSELKHNKLVGYDRATISLLDYDGSRYLLVHDPARTNPDRHLLINTEKDKLIQKVISDGVVILDVDAMRSKGTDLANIGWEDSEATQDINSWIGITLKSYNRDIAIITLDSQEKGIYSRFGENISQFLENFRLIAGDMIDSLMQTRNKKALDDIIASIGDDLHSEELVREILVKLKAVLQCDNCTFFRTSSSHDSEGVFVSKWVGANDTLKSPLYNKKVRIFRKEEGLAGHVLADNKSRIVAHALESPDFWPTPRLSGAGLSMLVVPVRSSASSRDQVVGLISCYKKQPDFFTIYDRDLIEQVALYTASTIERTMVLEYSNEISKEINNLNNVLEGNNRFLILHKICEYALNVTGANEAVLHRLQFVAEENGKSIYRPTGESYNFPEELKLTSPRLDGTGVTDAVIQRGTIVQFSEEEGNFDYVSDELKQQGIKHITGIPLVVRKQGDDEIIGVLYLSKYTEGRLSKIEEFSLELFASQAANAIKNQEFLRERQTWTNAHTGLAEAIEVVTRSFDQSQIALTFRDIILQAHKLVNASFSYLALYVGENKFEFRTAWPEWILAELVSEVRMFNPHTGNPKFDHKKGVTGLAVERGKTIHIQDIEEERRKNSIEWNHYIEFRKETRSELAVPIRSEPDGKIIGVINLEHKEPYAFTEVHCQVIQLFARQVAIAFQKSDLFKEIQNQHDVMRDLQHSMQEIAASPPNEMLYRAVSLTSHALNASMVMFIPISRDQNDIPVITTSGIVSNVSRYQSIKNDIARHDDIAIATFQSNDLFFCSDVYAAKQESTQIAKHPLLRDHVGSALCIPLEKQKDCIGVMWILLQHNRPSKTLSNEERDIFRVYANQIALAYTNATKSAELFEMLNSAQNDITRQIEKHYQDTHGQSRTYYIISLFATFLGLTLFICVAALLFSDLSYKQPAAIITSVVALLTEIVSVFVFSRANAAHERMDKYHRELFKVRQFNILLLASDQLEKQEQTKQAVIESATKSWFHGNAEQQ